MPLDETISEGQAGHIADHETIAARVNELLVAPGYTMIAAAETTASATYTDLTTAGPAVTLTVPASGKVEVVISSEMSNASGTALASYAVSGASTVAADDDRSIGSNSSTRHTSSRTMLVTGLTPGSTTFTMKYRSTSGTATWVRRSIFVRTVP